MAKKEISIERDKNLFIVKRDNNLEHLINISLVFYQNILSFMEKAEGSVLELSPKFAALIEKITNDSKEIYLSEEDFALFADWVDCLCLIMLEMDTIDYNDKQIKKYLSISESFIKKSKELIVNQKNKKDE